MKNVSAIMLVFVAIIIYYRYTYTMALSMYLSLALTVFVLSFFAVYLETKNILISFAAAALSWIGMGMIM